MSFENPDLLSEVKILPPITGDTAGEKARRAITCLEMLQKYDLISLNEWELGNEWLAAYWWADGPEQETEAAHAVISYFEEALAKDLVPAEKQLGIKYLIGEIHRRIGEIEVANACFDAVLEELESAGLRGGKLYELVLQQRQASSGETRGDGPVPSKITDVF
jgi:hypothetical protein